MTSHEGMASRTSGCHSPWLSTCRISDCTNPGQTLVTAIPSAAISYHSEWANACNANLLMQYADTPGEATYPDTLLIIARLPLVFLSSGKAAYAVRSTPKTFVSNCA